MTKIIRPVRLARPERAEAPSPGQRPGLGASALSGRAAYRSFGTFQPYRSKLFDFIIYILSFFWFSSVKELKCSFVICSWIFPIMCFLTNRIADGKIWFVTIVYGLFRLWILFVFRDVYLFISLLSVVLHIYACWFWGCG